MTADPMPPVASDLELTVEDAHLHARAALQAEQRPIDAVVWLSAHLAAVTRTVEPLAARRVHRRHLDAHLGAVRRLERLLRVAERRHSGDALAASVDATRLTDALLRALREHEDAEHALLSSLAATLGADEARAVVSSYADALEHAPTRPHPHAPHTGVLGAIAFRVDAVRDHVMDTMDARHVPLPRVPRDHAAPGRWGSYLLGRMSPPDDGTAP